MPQDRVEKNIVLKAPRSRVWSAITDAQEFGNWFGIDFNGTRGTFQPGTKVDGIWSGTKVDPEMRERFRKNEGLPFHMWIDRLEPEHLFAYRWHQMSARPEETGLDVNTEPPTEVIFTLKEVPEGTLLTVMESGFDKIPPARKARVLQGVEAGWPICLGWISKHITHHPRWAP
jgi:uncharacterized protein YndB with AHSA1/START domain